jgi:hypothetical protein
MKGEFRSFCILVRDFCSEYAEVTKLKRCVSEGKEIDSSRLNVLLFSLSEKIAQIEEKERILGYERVGIPLEDANFEGISIVNGEVEGERVKNAYLIAEPWILNFWNGEQTEESDAYKFFIGMFLYCMAEVIDPTVMNELKEDDVYGQKYREAQNKEDKGALSYTGDRVGRHRHLLLERVYSFFCKKQGSAEKHLFHDDRGRRCG